MGGVCGVQGKVPYGGLPMLTHYEPRRGFIWAEKTLFMGPPPGGRACARTAIRAVIARTSIALGTRALGARSSVGQSTSFTPRGSPVRVGPRPFHVQFPNSHRRDRLRAG